MHICTQINKSNGNAKHQVVLKCTPRKYFEIKKLKKINKSHLIWKYGQILTIQKSLITKWLKISKKRFIIWVYHFVLHYILSPNNKFGMWINIKFSILWCSNQTTNPYFSTSKVHYYYQMIFLLVNNHTILCIRKLLVLIQVLINKYKDILIITCIWIKST
jgi:hypothetical protein